MDDWIFNLNIGNVMHLSLMGTDELSQIDKKDSNPEVVSKSSNTLISQSSNGKKPESKTSLDDKMSPLEISHELCKDAMLEKIVLISVAYFCIATEMRFII